MEMGPLLTYHKNWAFSAIGIDLELDIITLKIHSWSCAESQSPIGASLIPREGLLLLNVGFCFSQRSHFDWPITIFLKNIKNSSKMKADRYFSLW
jgi:hypothetical protein